VIDAYTCSRFNVYTILSVGSKTLTITRLAFPVTSLPLFGFRQKDLDCKKFRFNFEIDRVRSLS